MTPSECKLTWALSFRKKPVFGEHSLDRQHCDQQDQATADQEASASSDGRLAAPAYPVNQNSRQGMVKHVLCLARWPA
jgi:hypothetical protein